MQATPTIYWTQKLELAQAQLATFESWDALNPMKLTCVSFALKDVAEATYKLASAERAEKLATEHAASVAAYNALPFIKRLFTSNPSR